MERDGCVEGGMESGREEGRQAGSLGGKSKRDHKGPVLGSGSISKKDQET